MSLISSSAVTLDQANKSFFQFYCNGEVISTIESFLEDEFSANGFSSF